MQTGTRIKIDDLLAYAFVVSYKLPAMAGYGEHWELSKEESRQLGSTLKACLESLPEERKRRITKRVENFLPWIALVAFGGLMTYQRVMITRMMLERERHARRYNMGPKVAETASPETRDMNAQGPLESDVPRSDGHQPGFTFSGGHDLPLPFVVPE